MGAILEATAYLYITFFGVTIFKEKLRRDKAVALLLIQWAVSLCTRWVCRKLTEGLYACFGSYPLLLLGENDRHRRRSNASLNSSKRDTNTNSSL